MKLNISVHVKIVMTEISSFYPVYDL